MFLSNIKQQEKMTSIEIIIKEVQDISTGEARLPWPAA